MKLLFVKIIFFFLVFQPVFALQIPGEKYFIDINSLPTPYATKSVANSFYFLNEGLCKLSVPKNFKVKLFAQNLTNPRNIKVAQIGDVFVVEARTGKIKILRDINNDGKSDIQETLADGFNKPFGIEINKNYLFIADIDYLWRISYKLGQLKAEETPVKITKNNALGDGSGHWTRNIVLLNNKMYISIGSRGNIEIEDNPRGTIQEFDLKTKKQKIFATGLRNPIGIDVHPVTKKLFTVVNERDGMGDDLVPDYFSKVEKDDFFGWPFFYLGNNIQPNINIHKNYNNVFVKKPDVLIKSHSGPIDLIFYNKKQFPAELYGDAFVALHGSWNSSKPQGYMVIKIPFKKNKPLGYYETFVTGFWISGPERANICGRPAGLGITIDGSLLISDDLNNTIWHVHYVK